MTDFLLSYDTVTLRPRYSELKSRALADTSIDFLGKKFNLPVVPSNMLDVINVDISRWMSENDYFYIMHRFENKTKELIQTANEEQWKTISISVGVNEESLKTSLHDVMMGKYRVDYVTIDVAHGHHENIKDAVLWLRHHVPNVRIIAGNVATSEGIAYLAGECNVDAVKVGIGGGGICTTRYKTGFHLPTLHSIFEATSTLTDLNLEIPIIADGGAKHYGDIAKALTFGASMVMAGGWFASCIDSPAKIENGKKIYRGSTSFAAKGENKHVEGRILELESGVTIAERLTEIKQSLQSSISYAGGTDLSSFNNVGYGRILPFH